MNYVHSETGARKLLGHQVIGVNDPAGAIPDTEIVSTCKPLPTQTFPLA